MARGDRQAAAELRRAPEIHIGPRAQKIAEYGRAPRSRARTDKLAKPQAGRWVSSSQPDRRERTVDYQRIDQGGRAAFNASRVQQNADRQRARIERLRVRAARLRLIEARMERQLATVARDFADLARERDRPFWNRPSPERLSSEHARLTRLQQRYRSRSGLLHLILGRVGGILNGLLRSQELTLRRRRTLSDRINLRTLAQKRPNGRGRRLTR